MASQQTMSYPSTVDWKSWPLGRQMAPFMFIAHWSADTGLWSEGAVVPYGPLELMPAAQVLNYGQSIFEGMKAHRSAAGRIVLFRPHDNARRFFDGAERMAMPSVPVELFMRGVEQAVMANAHYVPPAEVGSLYLRPLLMGTGPLLGLCPAPSYTFCVYASPVGSRLKNGELSALQFKVEERYHRAAPRGIGGTKAAGNYSPCLVAQAGARAEGYHDVVFLDAKSDTYLEEGAGCNVFVVRGNVLITPPAQGSILPGITRASLLALAARRLGIEVREEPVAVQEAMQADEMFASGTMMVVQPVGSLTYNGTTKHFTRGDGQGADGVGPITRQLHRLLTDIQQEREPDAYGWVWPVCAFPEATTTPQASCDAAAEAALPEPKTQPDSSSQQAHQQAAADDADAGSSSDVSSSAAGVDPGDTYCLPETNTSCASSTSAAGDSSAAVDDEGAATTTATSGRKAADTAAAAGAGTLPSSSSVPLLTALLEGASLDSLNGLDPQSPAAPCGAVGNGHHAHHIEALLHKTLQGLGGAPLAALSPGRLRSLSGTQQQSGVAGDSGAASLVSPLLLKALITPTTPVASIAAAATPTKSLVAQPAAMSARPTSLYQDPNLG